MLFRPGPDQVEQGHGAEHAGDYEGHETVENRVDGRENDTEQNLVLWNLALLLDCDADVTAVVDDNGLVQGREPEERQVEEKAEDHDRADDDSVYGGCEQGLALDWVRYGSPALAGNVGVKVGREAAEQIAEEKHDLAGVDAVWADGDVEQHFQVLATAAEY